MEIKKILAIFFIILVISTIIPGKAKAVWGVEDIVFDPQSWTTTVSNWATQVIKWAKDSYQMILRDIIAKRIMDYIVDQTITWIQGGGEPKFISNWDGFLKDASGTIITFAGAKISTANYLYFRRYC